MAAEWRENWGDLKAAARRAGDAMQSRRHRWAEWRGRPRRPVFVVPEWVAERRLLIKWKLQEWCWGIALRWVRITHPVVEWFWLRAAAVARRIDEARDRIAYRLKPLVWRIADWLERRTLAAAARKSAIATRLAVLREMRVRPAVRAVENRVHVGAAVRSGREMGLSPGVVLIACGLIAAAVYVRWTMREPPPSLASDEEITLANSFLTGTGGFAPKSDDPQAWLRQLPSPSK